MPGPPCSARLVEVNEDKVEARFKNRVLTVWLPKSAEAHAKTRQIEAKAA